MKTSLHTPGPWKVFNSFGLRSLKSWHISADEKKARPVATIADIDDSDRHNANLIAAAPELLAALEKCENVIGFSTLQGKLSGNPFSEASEALVAARKALDKVRQ